jgi:hypothetical protein
MTIEGFRRLALRPPEAIEAGHLGHPDFRVGGRIFATLGHPADDWAMVALTREQQVADSGPGFWLGSRLSSSGLLSCFRRRVGIFLACVLVPGLL